MKRYIALLRGINIGGKNKISMSELKNGFQKLGFAEVVTYLNSGNVVFSSVIDDINALSDKIVLMIKDRFDSDVPVFVVLQEELKKLLMHAPDWWGDDNKVIYDNLIFMMPPLFYEEFNESIGEPKAEYEKAQNYKNVIFWSFSRKDYQRTNWWKKTANSPVSGKITIRTAGTVRKIAEL